MGPQMWLLQGSVEAWVQPTQAAPMKMEPSFQQQRACSLLGETQAQKSVGFRHTRVTRASYKAGPKKTIRWFFSR